MKTKQWIVIGLCVGQILLIQKNMFPNDIKIYDNKWNRTGEIQQKTKDKYTEYDKNWNIQKYYKIDNGKVNIYDKNWNRIKELNKKNEK